MEDRGGGTKVKRKLVLITGTSSGFGLLTALTLAKHGYFVIAAMRDLSKKEKLLSLAKKEGIDQQIEIVSLDVTNKEDIDQLIASIEEKYGFIHILINNAGYCQGGLVEQIPMNDWEKQFQTNFFSCVALTKAVLPTMRRRREGKIIFLGSISGRIGLPGMGAYASSKFALEGFVESLRLEVKPFQIDISIIEAGSFQTNIWEKSIKDVEGEVEEDYASMFQAVFSSAKQSAKQAGDPMEVVNLILHICETRNAKLRYPIGKGVKLTTFLKNILPWELVEKFIDKKLTSSN